ncbi:DapH/DapD/GlmU-related protein [Sphaerotilus sulfidivorans]|uniref:DapH/DapD/GlmU-related protein n=1 Tax=Sphaerotilus sp. FB-3 TaxID=2913396 RepID=UPI002040A51C|nr:DapH/DapD/GlmU-related protein [Sphaerotilus sp. FB-3]
MNIFKKLLKTIILRINGNIVKSSVVFDEKTKFSIGNYVGNDCELYSVKIGIYSYINSGCCIDNAVIGGFSCIGRNVIIGLGQHPVDRVLFHRMFYASGIGVWKKFFFENNFSEVKETKIGSDVWIGAGSMVMDGVEIGNGTLVAAGSVVTKNLDEYSIYAGVPAKKIKNRFKNDDVKKYISDFNTSSLMSADDICNLAKTGFFNKGENDFENSQDFIDFLESKRVFLEKNNFTVN